MRILVLGAGAWGTALAIHAVRKQTQQEGNANAVQTPSVGLWARNPELAQQMQQQSCNQRYLPDQPLPANLSVLTGDPTSAIAASKLVIVASPLVGLRRLLQKIQESGHRGAVIWVCKGFEMDSGLLPHEVKQQVAPQMYGGSLSGPSFAQEVAQGLPCALTIASTDASVTKATIDYLHDAHMRIYESSDLVGVEVGGAMKNILAIATGLCDGLHLGLNARAALITRGLAEMTRLGLKLGAQASTFMGLSGLGDLVLTTTGDLSRNRKIGLLLAQGIDAQAATAQLAHVAEGVYSAATVLQRAQSVGVEVPITACVSALLQGRINPQEALSSLMARSAKTEF